MARSLLCRARTRLCAVPVANVVETMRPLPVERVASSSALVPGLAVIRGTPTPVVDLGQLVDPTSASGHGRFVVLALGTRRVALAVEAVVGVRGLEDTAHAELSPLLAGIGREAIDFVGTLDGELLVVLAASRIVPEAAWTMALEAEARS